MAEQQVGLLGAQGGNDATPAALGPAEKKARRNKTVLMLMGLSALNGVLWPWSIWEQRVAQHLDDSSECQLDPGQCADFGSAIIFSLLAGLGPLCGLVVGPMLGARRAKPTTLARLATALHVFGFLCGALAMHLRANWLLIVGFGVFCGIGSGIGFVVTVLMLVQWFVYAGGKPGTGSGFQGVCDPVMAIIFSQTQYWLLYADVGVDGVARASEVPLSVVMLIMAAAVTCLTMPACLWLEMPPLDNPTTGGVSSPVTRSTLARRDIVRTSTYWIFMLCLLVGEVPGWSLQSFIAPLVSSSLHSPPYYSTCILSAFLLVFSIGRLCMGILGDKIGAIRVWQCATLCQAGCTVGFALLFNQREEAFVGVLVVTAVVGACFSAIKVSVPGILAQAWGHPAHVSPVMGATGPSIGLSVLAGANGLYYAQRDGTSITFFYICAAMSVASCVVVTFLPKPPQDLPGLQVMVSESDAEKAATGGFQRPKTLSELNPYESFSFDVSAPREFSLSPAHTSS